MFTSMGDGVVSGAVSGLTDSNNNPCSHANGNLNTNNNSTTVQLSPFSATPNAGGEYKVYLISEALGAAVDANNLLVIDFTDSQAKTDNFKLRNQPSGCTSNCTPPVLTGLKWYDTNTNGVKDSGEPTIPGWRINGQDSSTSLTFFSYTDASGNYSFPVDSGNTYTISEVLANATWTATGCVGNASTTCITNTSANVDTGTASTVPGPNFGNVCTGGGGGLTIGYWSNQNGQAEWVPIPFDNPYLVGPNTKSWKYMDFSSATSYAGERAHLRWTFRWNPSHGLLQTHDVWFCQRPECDECSLLRPVDECGGGHDQGVVYA